MWTAGEIAMQALPSGVTLAPTASMALDRLSTHNSCGCTNTARPCNQLHKTTPQAIHGFRKKFYWCPVAPIFSPAGEKIEQVKVEQEIRRTHKAETKKSLSPK